MKQLPSGRGLFIAEKSSAMESFKKVYDSIKSTLPYTLDFEKFHGHVVELAPPGFYNPEWNSNDLDILPMIPEKWTYIPGKDIDRKTQKVLGPIDKLYLKVQNAIETGGYDFLVCGTDPEREGNLIFDAFLGTLEPKFQVIKKYRFWNNGTTSVEIEKAFRNLLSYNEIISGTMTVQNLSDAAVLRARMDWLIGLNSTKLVSSKAGFTVSTGRVRNPVEKIIVDRELQISNFVPEQFFTIKSTFSQNGQTYFGTLTDLETGQAQRFKTKEDAEVILNELKDLDARITLLEKKKKRERPASGTEKGSLGFFSIDSLQGAAARVFGISKTETLSIASKLYENNIITYARTDSAYITTEDASNIAMLFDVVRKMPEFSGIMTPLDSDIASFVQNKKYVNNKEVRGHSAILPLPGDNFSYNKLSEKEKQILYLITRSVILPFLPDKVVEKTKVETKVGDYLFRSSGTILVEEGWSALIKESKSRDFILPNLSEGDVLFDSGEVKEGWTTPPERYDVDSLGAVMVNVHRLLSSDEEKLAMQKAEGIGRPSTRTAILQSLIDQERISCDGKTQQYFAEPFGIEVTKNLMNTELVSPHLTAKWEVRLQEVEDGLVTADQVYKEIVAYVDSTIRSLKKITVNFSEIPNYAKKEPIGELPNGNKVFKSNNGSYYDEEFQAWIEEKNEAEKEGWEIPEFRGFYLQSMLDNSKIRLKTKLSDKEVKTLISGGQVEKTIIWKESNSESNKFLELDNEFKLSFVKTVTNQTATKFNIGSLEVIRVDLEKDGKKHRFFLPGGKESGIQIYGYVAGRAIENEEFGTLLSGGQIEVDNLKNKKNENFSGILFFDKEKNAISIRYPDIPKEILYSENGAIVEKRKSKGGDYYYLVNNIYVPISRARHEFSLDELIILATTKELALNDLWSEKKEKTYSAILYLSDDKLEQRFE